MITDQKQAQVDPVDDFVGELESLAERDDRAALARLRRCVGRDISQSPAVYGLFYGMLPRGVLGRDWKERQYFLLATLFALAPKAGTGDLGQALRRAAERKPESAKAIERRLTILLDSSADELPHRLRQAIQWLAASEISIDWRHLLRDLLDWELPSRKVQKRWARSYFGRASVAAGDQGAGSGPSEDRPVPPTDNDRSSLN